MCRAASEGDRGVVGGTGSPAPTEEHTMNVTVTDPLFVRAEVEYRLERAGVDTRHPQHGVRRRPGHGPRVHPLAAVVARLTGPRPAGRPRHP